MILISRQLYANYILIILQVNLATAKTVEIITQGDSRAGTVEMISCIIFSLTMFCSLKTSAFICLQMDQEVVAHQTTSHWPLLLKLFKLEEFG